MTYKQSHLNTVPIVFSADIYYIPYMSAAMQSIMENSSPNSRYCFFVLHKDIDANHINIIEKQISAFPQFSIEFIDVTSFINGRTFFISRHIAVESYFRLLIPELLPEYKKIIYVDGDMICTTDIAPLLDINMENYLIAAVRDVPGVSWYHGPRHSKNRKKRFSVLLQLKNPDEYFNAGLLVINIELFNKTITIDKLLELAASREWQNYDQDVLNVVAEKKTFFLSFRWNFHHPIRPKYLPDQIKQEYSEAEKNPNIIHYKPWTFAFHIKFFELFWKYSTRTPFINVIVERMKSNEFINFRFREMLFAKIKQKIKSYFI
jgi:lipopolysaccharide biosynthesis glycosyltransferase